MVRAVAAVFLVALATVSTVALVAASTASAKDGIEFPRTQAHVGDRIVLASAWTSHPNGLVAYFMPLSISGRWWHIGYTGTPTPNNGPPPNIHGVIRLGALHAHGRAVRLAFRVPDVPAGRYVLGIWCKPCNEHWTTALPNWQPLPAGILRVRA